MTWKSEKEVWICSECGTLYNLPADAAMLVEAGEPDEPCCPQVRRMDVLAFKQHEREEDAQREPWEAADDGYGRGGGFYFEVDDD